MENMNILLNYIKTLEKLLLNLINENNIKTKQINKKIQNLIIILSQNGLKPNEIDSCIDENNNNNNNLKYSDYDTDNDENDEAYAQYFLDEKLKENILDFFNQKHRSMKQLGINISDIDFEEKKENNNINNDLIENNNYLNKKKEREKNINESDDIFNKEK